MKLNDLKIKNLKPRKKPYKTSDGNGLYLFIMPSGGKSWRYSYKLKIDIDTYKHGTFVYGTYPNISLIEARNTHICIRKLVSQSIDPNQHKKEQERLEFQNQPTTFEEISKDWLNKKGYEVKPGTLEGIKKRLKKDVYPEIGNIPLNKLCPSDILGMLKKLENRGAYSMIYRSRQYCSQILRFAVAHGKVERDFTSDIRDAFPARSVQHQPAFQPYEIPEFLDALIYNEARLFSQTRLALKMLMLTFVRPIELASAKWSEIDFESNLWIIPATKMKMKLDHIVPLSHQTLKILEVMQQRTGKCEYVFVKQRKPKEHMSRDTLSNAVRSLGFQGRHTAHGFRALARTTIREKLKWDSEVIERQLAHTPNTSLGRTYDRTQFIDERIVMMQEWADYLDEVDKRKSI